MKHPQLKLRWVANLVAKTDKTLQKENPSQWISSRNRYLTLLNLLRDSPTFSKWFSESIALLHLRDPFKEEVYRQFQWMQHRPEWLKHQRKIMQDINRFTVKYKPCNFVMLENQRHCGIPFERYFNAPSSPPKTGYNFDCWIYSLSFPITPVDPPAQEIFYFHNL